MKRTIVIMVVLAALILVLRTSADDGKASKEIPFGTRVHVDRPPASDVGRVPWRTSRPSETSAPARAPTPLPRRTKDEWRDDFEAHVRICLGPRRENEGHVYLAATFHPDRNGWWEATTLMPPAIQTAEQEIINAAEECANDYLDQDQNHLLYAPNSEVSFGWAFEF